MQLMLFQQILNNYLEHSLHEPNFCLNKRYMCRVFVYVCELINCSFRTQKQLKIRVYLCV